MESVIGRLDDSVMRMVIDSVDESSKAHLSDQVGKNTEKSGRKTDKADTEDTKLKAEE